MNLKQTLLEINDGIAVITINREKSLNAINQEVMADLHFLFHEHLPTLPLKGVIITGAGSKAFVAGADISEFPKFDISMGSELSRKGHVVFNQIENFHVPVIAAVNGFALGGGCELTMACHMRVAGEHAKFGQPEVNLGLIPGYGGTQRLPQLVGKAKAIELLLTGNMVGAEEAVSIGLANWSTDAGMEVDKAKEVIEKIGTKGPLAIKHTIESVNAHYDGSKDGFETEIKYFGVCMGSEESKEGVDAFLNKRKANFHKKG